MSWHQFSVLFCCDENAMQDQQSQLGGDPTVMLLRQIRDEQKFLRRMSRTFGKLSRFGER